MKINIKERLKNKTFVVTMAALVIALVYQMLALCDVVPSISQSAVTEVVGMVINVLGMLGVIVDPTTAGINDSARALTYGTEHDVRQEEISDE